MQLTMDETEYRRQKQLTYNKEHNITPRAIKKSLENALAKEKLHPYTFDTAVSLAAEEKEGFLTKSQLEKKIRDTRKEMEKAAKELDFIMAAKLRDKIKQYQKQMEDVEQ